MSDDAQAPPPPPAAAPPPPPAAAPPPPPAGGDETGGKSENRGIMVVLSYLWLLALVPLLIEKDDKEVQWHAKHGLVLLLAEFALWISFWIVTIVLGSMLGDFGCFASMVGTLLWVVILIGIFVVHGMCIFKGVNGQRFTVPVVSDFANKL